MQLDGNQYELHTFFQESINNIVIVRNPIFIDFGSKTICKQKQKTYTLSSN